MNGFEDLDGDDVHLKAWTVTMRMWTIHLKAWTVTMRMWNMAWTVIVDDPFEGLDGDNEDVDDPFEGLDGDNEDVDDPFEGLDGDNEDVDDPFEAWTVTMRM